MWLARIVGNVLVWMVAFCALGAVSGFAVAALVEPWFVRQALAIMGVEGATEPLPLAAGLVGPALATMILAGPAVVTAAYCASKLTPRLGGWRVALPVVPMLAAASLPWWYAQRLGAVHGEETWVVAEVAAARLFAVAIVAAVPAALLSAYLGCLAAPRMPASEEALETEGE